MHGLVFLAYLLGQPVLNLQRNSTLKINIEEIYSFISEMSRQDISAFHITPVSLGYGQKY